MAKAVNIPVTVKIRKGWDESSVNAVEVAKRCEEAGAAAITIHGRTRVQMYAPPVDWDIIAQVKQAVSIPVIGNGDVVEPEDAARLYEHTNCDFIMIGRGACGNPWIFQRVNALLEHGVVLPAPGPAERMRVMCLHLKALCEAKGEAHAMREARKHAAWYMKGLNGAAEFRPAGRYAGAVRGSTAACRRRNTNESVFLIQDAVFPHFIPDKWKTFRKGSCP